MDLEERLSAAVQEAENWHQVGTRLREQAGTPDADPIWPLVWAFQYDLTEPGEERRDRWGPFAPLAEFREGVFPPPLTEVSEGTLGLWVGVADGLQDAVVQSRLNDLLWERRVRPRPDKRGRSAVEAYIQLSEGEWHAIDRAHCLVRALEIALQLNDGDLQERVARGAVSETRKGLAEGSDKPGVTIRLLESLTWFPPERRPPELMALLQEASRVYEQPHALDAITDLQAGLHRDDPNAVAKLRREQVERWRRHANQSTGIARLLHLRRSHELAQLYQISDLATQTQLDIQSLSVEDLALTEVRVATDIPRERIDQAVRVLLSQGDWKECLRSFGAYGPPSGPFVLNKKHVRRLMKKHPIQYIFPKTLVDEHGIPIKVAKTQDDHENMALADHENRQIALFSFLLACQFLDRFPREHEFGAKEDLVQYFSTPFIQNERAERIAQAFILYWEEEYDACMHILLPRLEAVIRDLCQNAGLVVIRPPTGRQAGGVKTLGTLLRSLEGNFEEGWRRYLFNALVDPLGYNLRNRALHGLIDSGTKEDAALLLHIACFLRLVAPKEAQP